MVIHSLNIRWAGSIVRPLEANPPLVVDADAVLAGAIAAERGLVRRVCDWPHSTFHRFVRLGLYPPDWAGGGIEGPLDEFGEIEE